MYPMLVQLTAIRAETEWLLTQCYATDFADDLAFVVTNFGPSNPQPTNNPTPQPTNFPTASPETPSPTTFPTDAPTNEVSIVE